MLYGKLRLVLSGIHYFIILCMLLSIGVGIDGVTDAPVERQHVYIQGIAFYVFLLGLYIGFVTAALRFYKKHIIKE